MVQLPQSLRHNVLWILIYSDKYAKQVRQLLDIQSWLGDPIFTTFIETLYKYIDAWEAPPKELVDSLIDGLPFKDDKKSMLRQSVALCQGHRADNHDYVMSVIQKYHHQTELRDNIQKAAMLVNDANRLDEVDEMLGKAIQKKDFTNHGRSLKEAIERRMIFQEEASMNDRLSTGIHALDRVGAVPKRKTMTLFMALQKFGKSWFFIHMGKRALIEGKKVLHVTLENSQEETEDRYMQSLAGFTSNKFSEVKGRFIPNEDGTFSTIQDQAKSLDDLGSVSEFYRNTTNVKYLEDNLRIVEFPSKSLHINKLKAYMDGLQIQYDFQPDVLIIDYPDLMAFNSSNYRIEIGELYAKLRGIAQERNLILLVASQVQRMAASAKRIEMGHVAEDQHKVSHSDLILSYHRSTFEEQNGLGRIYVAASRYSRMGIEALLFQNYATGQFSLDSKEYTKEWEGRVKDAENMNA